MASHAQFKHIATLIKQAEEAFEALDRTCFNASLTFWKEILPQLAASEDWTIEVEDPCYYRCLLHKFQPLSIAGSLATGGRFNVGGSQAAASAKPAFEKLAAMRGALYLSETWQTAANEQYRGVADPETIYALLRSDHELAMHEIRLLRRKKIRLVDYDRAIRDIEAMFPGASPLLAVTPRMYGDWSDLKRPAPCQLLGHWLVDSLAVDGIRFPSTAHPDGWNVCLHLADDVAAKKLLKAKIYPLMV